MTDAGCPLKADRIAELSGLHGSVVYKVLNDRRGRLVYVADWLITTRKPAALWMLGCKPDAHHPLRGKQNPFAVAAGLVAIPEGRRGRIYQQSMSITDKELAA
ncbi:hypothetical protein [Caballeronia glathei]|nr:hypothetical protein [Caballeronia glathei]